MREGIGDDRTLRLPLQAVVADGVGGDQSSLDVAWIEHLLGPLHMVGPDPCQIIGLELETHGQAVSLYFPSSALLFADLSLTPVNRGHGVRFHAQSRKPAQNSQVPPNCCFRSAKNCNIEIEYLGLRDSKRAPTFGLA